MQVTDIRITEQGPGVTRVTASVTSATWDRPREVWFEVPTDVADAGALGVADPWYAALLLPAMRRHEDLRIDAPLSQELVATQSQVQDFYSMWLPSSRRADVSAEGWPDLEAEGDGVGLFFSCGVDSWYSLLKSETQRKVGRSGLTHLVTVAGVDIDVGEWKADVVGTVQENTRRIAEEVGLSSVALATNVRQLYTSIGLSWRWGQAGALAAVALLLQRRFSRMIVASSLTSAMIAMDPEVAAFGCHPLLMPLFSTRLCELSVDGGESSRLQKVERVVESSHAMATLRVCWANHEPGYNCGKCGKCIRTSLELEVIGALTDAWTLPHPIDPEAIRSMGLLFPTDIHFLEERYRRLRELDADPEILAAIERCLERTTREYEGRRRAMDLLQDLVGAGALRDPGRGRAALRSRPDPRRCPAVHGGEWRLQRPALGRRPRDPWSSPGPVLPGRGSWWSGKGDFWAFDHYPSFALHLEQSFPAIATTPDVRIYDLDDRVTA